MSHHIILLNLVFTEARFLWRKPKKKIVLEGAKLG